MNVCDGDGTGQGTGLRRSALRLVIGHLLALAAFLSGTACGPKQAPAGAGNDKPLIICTTTMITDLTRELGGDRIRLVGIMPPGVNPHTYEATPDAMILLRKADLVLYNGLHLEGRLADVIRDSCSRVAALAEDPRIVPRGSEQYEGAPDPHCWWDARLYMVFVERARDALTELDPDGRETYARRADAYLARLTTLDAQIRQAIERIPPARRYLITSHDAFYYYGAAYGLKVDAVLGISTDASVRPLRIEELARLVVRNRIPAIFHETAVSQSLNDMVNQVVVHAARQGHHVVIPSQPLYSDSLDEPGHPAGTYLGALRENTRIIVSALAGEDVSPLLAPKEVIRAPE